MKKRNIALWHAELNRVIDLVKFADQKSAIIAAGYSAVLGIIITNKESIINSNFDFGFWLVALLLGVIFIIGITNLFDAVCPRKKNNSHGVSYFYFGDVKTIDSNLFITDMSRMTEKEIEKQILEQIHTNSLIANAKMERVGKSTIYLFASVILCLIFVFVV